MFSVSSCSPCRDPHLVAAQAVARAERVALEVVAVGHRARGDVRQATSRPAAPTGTSCPKSGRRTRCRANTSLLRVGAVRHQQVGVAAGQHAAAADADRRPWRRSCWPPSRRCTAAACRRSRSPARRRACRTRRSAVRASWLASRQDAPSRRRTAAPRCRRARLNGAYFSRAMRSQVSSTASKVSREWSAKRARAVSDSTLQPVVEQEVERANGSVMRRLQRAAGNACSASDLESRPRVRPARLR